MKEDVIKCFLAERTVQRGIQNVCLEVGEGLGRAGGEKKK